MISRFDNIRVVLAEPRASDRKETVAALKRVGFSNIVASGNLSTVREAIEEGSADLLIVDTALPEGNVNKLIYRMRHGEVGKNPFLVVVTLVSKPSEQLITETIDSGTDDIAVKPFAMDYLCQRILSLTHSRKRFVVTTGYIGPDRRTKRRDEGMEIPQFIVPNPLRMRMTGQVGTGKMQRSIETASTYINEQKIQRHGYQVGYLAERIVPALQGGKVTDETIAHLGQLHEVACDISKRSKGSTFSHVREMCLTLTNMVESIHNDPANAHPTDIQLLARLTNIIKDTFDPERNEKYSSAGRELEKQQKADWAADSEDDFFKKDKSDASSDDGRDPDEMEEEMLAAAGG